MPVWKLDLVFEAAGRGWEETYYRNWTGPSFQDALTVATTLSQKRILLSGVPVKIKAYRISDPLTPGRQGQAVYFNPTIDASLPLLADSGSVSPGTSINVAWIHDTGNLTRQIQMRGVWDSAITNFNSLSSPAYAAWFDLFLQYRTYVLQQQFGWMNRPRAAEGQVTYAYGVGELWPTFTFPAAFWPLDQVGTFQYTRFSKFNGSDSPLNTELIVYVISQTSARASMPIAAGPMTAPGKVIRYGTPVFVQVNNLGVTRVGRRPPGAPLLYTPGRARKRARS